MMVREGPALKRRTSLETDISWKGKISLWKVLRRSGEFLNQIFKLGQTRGRENSRQTDRQAGWQVCLDKATGVLPEGCGSPEGET